MKLPDGLVRFALRAFGRMPRRVRRNAVRLGKPSFVVGSIAAVVVDDELLLVRQSYRRGWGLPGGLLDRGEEAEAAVRRELHEEVGLEVEVVGRPSVVVEAALRRVDVCYRCRPAAGVDRHAARPASAEIDEVSWVRLDALTDLQPEAVRGLLELGFDVPEGAGLSRPLRRTPP